MESTDQLHYDVSVVVTAHAEGALAHRTMRSLYAASTFAANAGLTTEIIVVLDSPTKDTRAYFEDHASDRTRIAIVEFRDLGSSRNHGVSIARGEFVAFLDADDLFSEGWLAKAVTFARSVGSPRTVVVPAVTIIFEAASISQQHYSSSDPRFSVQDLVENNLWTAVMVAPRLLVLQHPYCVARVASGFGYEDWHWYSNLLGNGGEVLVVPESCVFVRRKATNSLLDQHNKHRALLFPTPLLAPKAFGKMSPQKLARTSALSSAPRREHWSRRLYEQLGRLTWRSARKLVRSVPSSKPILQSMYRRTARLRRVINGVSPFPAWLVSEWTQIHDIEPQLYPDNDSFDKIVRYSVPRSQLGQIYADLCSKLTQDFTHIFLVPWLKSGGADLVTLNYVAHLATRMPSARILVLATEPATSPWAARLPEGVVFLESGALLSRLTADEQIFVIGTLLVQMEPDVIHNINSALGYQVFQRHGAALSHRSRLYASIFCTDRTRDGRHVGYGVNALPACEKHLTGVFTENRWFVDSLLEWFAFDPKKLHVHYQPVNRTPRLSRRGKADSIPFGILWAGRLDRQKRPDILAQIAQICRGLPVHFHVYGRSVLDNENYERQLEASNITFHGAFDGFEAIPVEDYDLFLNTSQWDGMPNIILEALAVGFPIVTSAVGGIPEIIEHEVTGLLVRSHEDAHSYAEAISRVTQDRALLHRMGEEGRNRVRIRHDQESFDQAIGECPEYYGRFASTCSSEFHADDADGSQNAERVNEASRTTPADIETRMIRDLETLHQVTDHILKQPR